MMKDEIIKKVFAEFENKINSGSIIEIPIVQKNNNWDMEDAFHYSFENGVKELIKNEGSDVCKIIDKGKRKYLIFEYKRDNRGGNQPARQIFMGEVIHDFRDDFELKIKGYKKTYADYCNSLSDFIKKIEKMHELDLFHFDFNEKMNGFNI